MKELDQIPKDEVVNVADKQQEKQLKFMGSIKPHPGHTLFELNMDDVIIRKAEFKTEEVDFMAASSGELALKKKVVIKQNCLYTSALNAKNADKKFVKMLSKK